MAHIKRMVMNGFKSFAKKTEIPFDKGINIIIGPNGSGKSNISDAICFVLGRLSVKSLRAEKARNLIFMGSKYIKPAKEAVVEIVFDNSDRAFEIDKDEISIKRIVRVYGQSIYKINGETKTRAEVIETLGQAGIDPYGYNIILQGQIQSIVKMHPEERRKIIGEVAGISVYEWRKEKSLKELEKTESRLKEISTILRERTAYLNNLEKEKTQAQRYKELQTTAKRAKASITFKKLEEKKKEIGAILKSIEMKMSQKDKKSKEAEMLQEKIDSLSEKINQINRHIREATGHEQGKLREEITNVRAELEGLKVRKEAYENRKEEVERRISQMKKSVPEAEREIKELKEKSPLIERKSKELKKKKEELVEIEKERKRVLSIKTELNSLKERIYDKKSQLSRANADTESIAKQIEEISLQMKYASEKEISHVISEFGNELLKKKAELNSLISEELQSERKISISNSEIERNNEIKNRVNEIDICPLCQSRIDENHLKHVFEDCDKKINLAKEELEKQSDLLKQTKRKIEKNKTSISEIEGGIRAAENELSSHKRLGEKRLSLNRYLESEKIVKKELSELESKRKLLENKTEDLSRIEEKYSNIILEIEEISSRTEEDVDTTLLYKERELEKIISIIERSKNDLEDIDVQIDELTSEIENNESDLAEKENQEKELTKRFNRMFSERDDFQKEVQELGIKLSETRGEEREIEDQINYLKIGRAKIDGEKETLEMDMIEYKGVELLQGSMNYLEERLKKSQETLNTIGSINMRALEVYDEIKKEYDKVKLKTETIEKEKEEILKIIEEIDKKKKRTFMKTFNAINSLFTDNFSKLSSKGTAYLEVENTEDIFEGGVNIVVKLGKGKYFDVTSLSGGEQTLVALSLLFSIQEYRPYQFYILDEIDAALDKRNSERLASLLSRYIKSGQYLIVTHNDAIILDSQILYGVSMHEGVSKILSLKLGEKA
ncbi:chromosome segregation protein SMC [Candidatus Pacearchaeota archaeon]|nr:chromosome segregation protein SMC [Candidatus Pacearchaeota archaeon]